MAKRKGDWVRVEFEGIVLNDTTDDGVRVSVKKPQDPKGSWWAIVPKAAVVKREPR